MEGRGFESWDKVSSSQHGVSIYILKGENATSIQVAAVAKLPNISKEVAFKALSDIKTRAVWDEIKFGLKVIEDDEENLRSVFYHSIATPFSYTNRDVVVQSKAFKGVTIGKGDAWCVVQKSVEHKDHPPLNPIRAIRIDLKENAFILQDDENGKGCVLTNIISVDYRGSGVP